MTDHEAEMAILAKCRATPSGRWVMRKMNGGALSHYAPGLYVIDLGWREPIPGGKYAWERRDAVVAHGETWGEVLTKLPADFATFKPAGRQA